MERTVTVTGSGSVQVAPDLAVVRVAAVHRAASAVEAMDGAFSASAAAGQAARAYVEERHVASTGVNLWNAHDNQGRPAGFEARHALRITCPDLAQAGPLLDALVTALGDRLQVEGVSLQVADATEARDRAVRAAYDDALARATRLAALAAATLGPVVSVAEGTGTPIGARVADLATAKVEATLEPGETTVSASVTASWQLEV